MSCRSPELHYCHAADGKPHPEELHEHQGFRQHEPGADGGHER
jgi:hypothetical protein